MKKILIISLVFSSALTYSYAQQGMGIGNNNPLEMLDVTGAIKIGTDINNGAGAPAGGAGTLRYKAGIFEGWNGSAWVPFSGGTLSGSGTTNYIPKWTGSTALGNSLLYDNGTNVGIGNTNPIYKLDVFASNADMARIGSSLIGGWVPNPAYAMLSNRALDQTVTGNYGFMQYTDGSTYVNASSTKAISFRENHVEKMILTNGNVGIGTATPDYKLHVSGTDYATLKLAAPANPLLKLSGSYNSGNGAEFWQDAAGDARLNINGAINAIYMKATGDVGIGMTFPSTPAARLDVNNGTSTVPIFLGRDNGMEVFRIADGGNVGIGTTAPAAKLELKGSGNTGQLINGGNNTNVYIDFAENGVLKANLVLFGNDDNFVINGFNTNVNTLMNPISGNVGIGVATSTTAKLEVGGQIKINGGSPGSNKVLRSDAAGLATWVDPNTLITAVTSIAADNGLTQGGTAAAPTIKLGGALTQASTIITQDGSESLTIANNSSSNTIIDLQNSGDFQVRTVSAPSSLTVTDAGNVGIGTSSPDRLFNLESASGAQMLFTRDDNNTNDNELMGELLFDNNDDTSPSSVDAAVVIRANASGNQGNSNKGGYLSFLTKNNSDGALPATERMRIAANGNVRIFNSNSLNFYDDAGSTLRGTIGQYAANSDMVVASNVSNSWLRIGANNSNIAFMPDNTYSSGSSPAVIITSNKRMGIGTTVPIAPLHVESQTTAGNEGSYGNFTFYAINSYTNSPNNPTSCCGGNVAGVSIHASGRVMASEFDAFSDVRIKNVVGTSNSAKDLSTLLSIEITDYTMKDKAKDFKSYKKVIAQQVESVYPQAVSQITDVVPDIYKVSSIKDGRVSLTTDLKVGDKVKLIFDEGAEMATVTSADANGFTVNQNRSGNVFVYGREVSDFRTVDYEAISMLNVSATQELFRLIQQLQKENSNLQAELKGFASLLFDVERLKEAVGIDLQSSK